jgi:hypothetical protein
MWEITLLAGFFARVRAGRNSTKVRAISAMLIFNFLILSNGWSPLEIEVDWEGSSFCAETGNEIGKLVQKGAAQPGSRCQRAI